MHNQVATTHGGGMLQGAMFDLPSTRVNHPARYTTALLPVMAELLHGARHVLDPFGGVGGVFELARWLPGARFECLEIQPRWAAYDSRITCGDATALPWRAGSFDAICTSPTYGNRMADHHNARDASHRHTYTHMHRGPLHPNNTGAMQWGTRYQDTHRRAWREAHRVLAPGGRFVLNCKDHIRGGVLVPVTAWHVITLIRIGFELVDWWLVPCPGMRNGANRDARVAHESVILLRRW